MVHFDQATGSLTLSIWLSAAVAAVIVVLAIMALIRSGAFKTLFALLALCVVAYGGWMGWQAFERFGNTERAEERRAFDRRVAELIGRTTTPGSPLSCLEGSAMEQVAAGCEKILFGSPENVAAAVAYVSARISLLVDGLDMAAHSEANYEAPLGILRRGLETDRFGVVAHVFGQQPNCLPQQCEMLVLLRDANKVRVNLQDKPFEALVAKYSPQWSQPRLAEPQRNPGMPPPPSAPAPLSSRFELPSSASIPPVSIMNSEPSAPAASASSSPSAPVGSQQSNPSTTGTAATPPRRPPVRAPGARAPGEAAPPNPAPSASNPPAAAPAVR